MSQKVRIIIRSLPYAGRLGGYRPHSIQEVDLDEAKLLVESGHAVYEDDNMTVAQSIAKPKAVAVEQKAADKAAGVVVEEKKVAKKEEKRDKPEPIKESK